jgi:SEC-C motif domain protein
MRSRYSAFATGETTYLLSTWHPATRPPAVELDPDQHWVHLELVGSTGGGFLDSEGTVEFRAHYRERGSNGILHENSRFVREGGRWSYLGLA